MGVQALQSNMKVTLCITTMTLAVSAMPQHLINGGHTVVAHPGGLAHGVGLAHGAVLGHGVGLAHGVAHGVAHHVTPVIHSAPVTTYGTTPSSGPAESYPDEVIPFTYEYSVSDDATGSNYNVAVSDDGTGVREGSYSVNLPDGRIQHVTYHANDVDGYVATVTYDGTASYPEDRVST